MLRTAKHFVIKNDLTELESSIDEVVDFCRTAGSAESILYDIRLALEESISNTIKYGYEDQESHEICLKLELENDFLIVGIEDDAKAFNPLEAPDPDLSLPIEEKPVGGLGIYLIKAVMDEIQYKRTAGKNVLRMKKVTHKL